MFALFVSPSESATHELKVMTFNTAEEMDKYISSCDLTKEHYGIEVKTLVEEIIRPNWPEDVE